VTVFSRRLILAVFIAAFVVYTAYVYTSGTETPADVALTGPVKNGLTLFQANNCIACHQFYGLGGYLGPDLTNVISAPGKGAEYAKAILEDGTPGMPDFSFSAVEVDDLIQFLKFVNASGEYPPRKPVIRWNGTVDYNGK
jgi:nitric oxide reductase subunit C